MLAGQVEIPRPVPALLVRSLQRARASSASPQSGGRSPETTQRSSAWRSKSQTMPPHLLPFSLAGYLRGTDLCGQVWLRMTGDRTLELVSSRQQPATCHNQFEAAVNVACGFNYFSFG